MMDAIGVCVFVLGVLFFQWRDQSFKKWTIVQDTLRENDKNEMTKQRLESANASFQADFEEYKKRVDALTLKAGFKL